MDFILWESVELEVFKRKSESEWELKAEGGNCWMGMGEIEVFK